MDTLTCREVLEGGECELGREVDGVLVVRLVEHAEVLGLRDTPPLRPVVSCKETDSGISQLYLSAFFFFFFFTTTSHKLGIMFYQL